MKILLYSDFSNYNNNLSKGLVSLGYEVVVISSGDGFKKIKADLIIKKYKKINIFGQIKLFSNFVKLLNKYDLVHVIHPYHLPIIIQVYLYILSTIGIKYNIFSALTGCDYVFWTTGRKTLNIPLFDEVIKNDNGKNISNTCMHKLCSFLTRKFIRGYIGMPEYYYPYKADANYKNKPLALTLPPANIKHNIDDIDFDKFINKDKLVFFHGIPKSREGFKGSHHIKKAFDIAREKYKNVAEFMTVESVPYDEYIEIMNKTDVLFDQTNGHTYGMAILEAMEAGKIVANSSQDSSFWYNISKDLDLEFIPKIYSLKPDHDFILSQIDQIISDKQKLPDIARHNRKFVEIYHDPKLIAKRHLDFWKKNMVEK